MTEEPLIGSQCSLCKHFLEYSKKYHAYVCRAFPTGIPEDVLWNERNHADPIPGDRGYRWELDVNNEANDRVTQAMEDARRDRGTTW